VSQERIDELPYSMQIISYQYRYEYRTVLYCSSASGEFQVRVLQLVQVLQYPAFASFPNEPLCTIPVASSVQYRMLLAVCRHCESKENKVETSRKRRRKLLPRRSTVPYRTVPYRTVPYRTGTLQHQHVRSLFHAPVAVM